MEAEIIELYDNYNSGLLDRREDQINPEYH